MQVTEKFFLRGVHFRPEHEKKSSKGKVRVGRAVRGMDTCTGHKEEKALLHMRW